ncbi:hypothetical protein Tco_1107022 [Tanacetum coccineum]
MGEPTTKEYISATCKSFISNDTNGKMIEKNFIEIEGTFLLKIRDNTFYGNEGEDVFKHINSFLKVVEPLKIRGLSHDRFRLSVFPTSLSSAAKEWFTNECIGTISTWDDLVKKFILKFCDLCEHNEEEETNDECDPDVIDDVPEFLKIDDDLFYFDSPLCIAFEEFNNLLKIDPDLFTYDIQGYQLCDHICEPYHFKNENAKWPTCTSDIDGFCNGGELQGMVRVGTMTYFQNHSWYDELVDGKLKDETLALKAKIEGSWGDATQGVLNLCRWLKNYFENFHELEYEVLVKLQECWWKVNTQEVSTFARIENFRRGPYANIMNEWGNNHRLGTNHISERNHEASNIGCENQEHKDNPTPDPSNCKVRKFEMMKYSFNDDEEYITIKESEHLNHSKKSLDAYRELLRLINEGWVVTTPDE